MATKLMNANSVAKWQRTLEYHVLNSDY